MKRILIAAALAVGLAMPAHADMSTTNVKIADGQAGLRLLWLGHIFWVREYARATFEKNAAEQKVAEDEIVEDAKNIGHAIEPFYGKPAGDKLFTLLAGHWGAIKEHIEATAKGDAKAQNAAIEKANKNVDDIATFLSGANPNLPKGTLVALLTAHVGHHATQNQQLHDKKYADEAKTWDAMHTHMNNIADALIDGIAKQFPDKFK